MELDFLHRPEFPKSGAYDPAWMMENQMGPNALWLMEWLSNALSLKPGMQIGRASCRESV